METIKVHVCRQKGRINLAKRYVDPDATSSFGELHESAKGDCMSTVLRELMRHESIETTMRFYVGQNAEATADEL